MIHYVVKNWATFTFFHNNSGKRVPLVGWVRFNSHQTHYRSYRGRVFTDQMTQPTVSKHWRKVLKIRLQSYQVHPPPHRVTIIQHICSMTTCGPTGIIVLSPQQYRLFLYNNLYVYTLRWAVLTVLWIGFCLTGPISLCIDSFVFILSYCVCVILL